MTARRWGRTIVTLAILVPPSIGSAGQNPDSRASRTYARAVELEAQGNHAAALSLLWEAAGLAPKDADIQNRLGERRRPAIFLPLECAFVRRRADITAPSVAQHET